MTSEAIHQPETGTKAEVVSGRVDRLVRRNRQPWVIRAGGVGPQCIYDTNGDGDCHRCAAKGGCVAVGGPFDRCIECCEIKADADMMSRQPYCRTCY